MKDRLSKQERQDLERYEKLGKLPVDGRDAATLSEPIVRRLVERGLLAIIPPKGDEMLTGVDITERGLEALRGGDWKGANG